MSLRGASRALPSCREATRPKFRVVNIILQAVRLISFILIPGLLYLRTWTATRQRINITSMFEGFAAGVYGSG
jgi:hypothetical protein